MRRTCERSTASDLLNPELLCVLAGLLAALILFGCASTGSATADAAIASMAPSASFWERVWSFATDMAFPMLMGAIFFAVAGGAGPVAIFFGTGGTASTAIAMRPDPPPTTINKTDVHVDAQPGSEVNVSSAAASPEILTAAQEPLMRTIEHYGFYILIAYVLWLKRDSWVAFVCGKIALVGAQGEKFSISVPRKEALKHALTGSRKTRQVMTGVTVAPLSKE